MGQILGHLRLKEMQCYAAFGAEGWGQRQGGLGAMLAQD